MLHNDERTFVTTGNYEDYNNKMQNEEIIKQDMAPDTGNNIPNITLLGDRVLIKLDEAQDHTVRESGIIVAIADVVETDGGRQTTRTSNKKWLQQGTIIQISDFSLKKMNEADWHTYPEAGDRVYVTANAVNPSYQFFLDRSQLVNDFDGHICIPHQLIEAKIN